MATQRGSDGVVYTSASVWQTVVALGTRLAHHQSTALRGWLFPGRFRPAVRLSFPLKRALQPQISRQHISVGCGRASKRCLLRLCCLEWGHCCKGFQDTSGRAFPNYPNLHLAALGTAGLITGRCWRQMKWIGNTGIGMQFC